VLITGWRLCIGYWQMLVRDRAKSIKVKFSFNEKMPITG